MADPAQAGANERAPVPFRDSERRVATAEMGRATRIRDVAEPDLAQVAALFLRLFRHGHKGRSTELEQCLADVLMRPARPASMPAGLVLTGPADTVQGFVACASQTMRLGGRRLTGLGGGTLMLDPAARHGATALLRLLRAFFAVPHDLSFTDTASPVSRAVLEQLGAQVLPLQSLDWLVHRSSAGLMLRFAMDRLRLTALDAAIGAALRTRSGWTGRGGPARRPRSPLRFADAQSTAETAAALVSIGASYALRPDWDDDPAPLRFRLEEAGRLRRHGAMITRIGFDEAGAPAAAWLGQLRPGGIGRVLQIVARPGQAGAAIDDLLDRAGEAGCVAVRGRLQPDLLAGLTRRDTVFVPRLTTLVRTSDAAVREEALTGSAWLTGLAGETWSRLMDDDFA